MIMKKYNLSKLNRMILAILICSSLLPIAACKKYLDAKPDQTLTTPTSLNDLQALLDYYALLNYNYPLAAEVASDDYYLTDNGLSGITTDYFRDYYLWQKNDNTNIEWQAYAKVYNANIILDNLDRLATSAAEQGRRNTIKASALFYRGLYFFSLSQLFAPPYDQASAASDLGIPLRLSSDFNLPSKRATVAATYNQMISDVQQALAALPNESPYRIRPTKPAAYGLLARMFLLKQDYQSAKLYADSCLQLNGKLLDYNSLDTVAAIPIAQANPEVIFDSRTLGSLPLSPTLWNVDTNFYKTYHSNDLRKSIFFKKTTTGTFTHKGNYTGTNTGFAFTGIATDELYLIRAECLARLGDAAGALNDLNLLLKNRIKTKAYQPLSYTNPNELLKVILLERRKELVFRTMRWSDIRRLSKEPLHAIAPTRLYKGKVYELPIGSERYLFQLPKIVIDETGMPQNP